MISRKDVKEGRVAPKTIENGVVVPPGLQVNCITLEEHRQRLAMIGAKPLTPEEEAALHPDEAPEASFTGCGFPWFEGCEQANPENRPSDELTPPTVPPGIKLDYGDRS